MATLEVNNNSVNFHPNEFLNVKSLMPKIQKQFPVENFLLHSFKINGDEIDLSSEHPKLVRPIDDTDKIQVIFKENSHYLESLLSDLGIITAKLIHKIDLCATQFKDEQDSLASKNLSVVIEGIDTFIQSFLYIHENIENKSELYETLPVKELQIHLLSVLKAITGAHKKNDTIMLTDLLEFELKDNLTQWKILVIPHLKKIIFES